MPMYQVFVPVDSFEVYEIEAPNEEAAIEGAADGYGEIVETYFDADRDWRRSFGQRDRYDWQRASAKEK